VYVFSQTYECSLLIVKLKKCKIKTAEKKKKSKEKKKLGAPNSERFSIRKQKW